MGEATKRPVPPASWSRIWLEDGERAALHASTMHLFSLDGERWYPTAQARNINEADATVMVCAPPGGGWLLTTDPGFCTVLPAGAELVAKARASVQVTSLPTVHVASMPAMERELLYDAELSVGQGVAPMAATPAVDVSDWRRARVEVIPVARVGTPRLEVMVGALASVQLEDVDPGPAAQWQPVDFDQFTPGLLVWAEPGAPIGPHTLPLGAGVRVYAMEGGDSDGRMTLGVRVWGFR